MNLSPHLQYEEEEHPGGKVLRFTGEADFIAVPAVRQLLDFLAQGFARLAAQGRCLAAV